ncbi:trypsin-like serine protease [Pseudomonas sp. TE50-2]|uniref:trypsin-like serine protease n=1 Tax=Pseudomonas sp. TE50-2 TaxID=3142707 RepID=UPI003467AD43
MLDLRTICLGLALSSPALAVDYGQGLPSPSEPVLLGNSRGENHHWTGIGRLNLPDNGLCMSTLLDTRSPSGEAKGPAYTVTAGHCISQHNGVIIQNQPLQASITFNFFADTVAEQQTIAVRRTVWSSVQGSDLALLELDASLRQLIDQGIAPMKPAFPAPPGTAVLVVGESIALNTGLRLRACTEEDMPVLVSPPWVWRNLKSNDCQGIAEGVSGSPVIERVSNRLIGVVNSISGDRVASIPLRHLLDCFDKGQLDMNVEQCHLFPGFQLQQQHHEGFKRLHKLRVDEDGVSRMPSWNFAFTLDTPRYRYKTARDARACEDPAGYSTTLPSTDSVLIDEPIGPGTGWHFLCVVGVDSAQELAWRGLMANALSIAVEVLPAVAVPAADVTVERLDNGDRRVSWTTTPPHLQRYRVKKGRPEQTDCADPSGYRVLLHKQYVFRHSDLPLKLCSQAEDVVKQRSAPREDLLEAIEH